MIMHNKKTWIMPVTNLLIAAVTIGVNLVLSKQLGIGAAVLASATSSALSIVLSLGATFTESRRCIDFPRVVVLWLLNIGILTGSMLLAAQPVSELGHIIMQLAACLLVLFIPFATRSFTVSEAVCFLGKLGRKR